MNALTVDLPHQLFLQFDWLDPFTGQEVLSDQFVFQIDLSAPIEAHWTLPFCPEEVSLDHFAEVFEGGVISVDGTFIHECIVPEPTSFLAWNLLGIAGVAAGRRRRRVR